MEKINDIELFIRKSISEEQLAVADYIKRREKLTKMLDDVKADEQELINRFINTLDDVINEEKIHIGQFTEMLDIFGISTEKEIEGEQEASSQDSFITVTDKMKKYVEEE